MHFDVACFQGECICLGGVFRLCLLIALVICSGGACELVSLCVLFALLHVFRVSFVCSLALVHVVRGSL
jgi:hypothetical protein